MKSVQLDKN